MTLKYQVEHFDAVKIEAFVSEILPLMRLHFEEEGNTEEFNPDVVVLARAWSGGTFQVITARSDGALVGYMVVSVTSGLLSKEKAGNIISVFMLKEFRGKGRGKQLFELAKNIMVAMGAKRIVASVKQKTPYARWLKMYGFKLDSESLVYGC